jgi:hypothetical protein
MRIDPTVLYGITDCRDFHIRLRIERLSPCRGYGSDILSHLPLIAPRGEVRRGTAMKRNWTTEELVEE